MNDCYERFKNEELILRDELAIDRTLLANERTLMAYLRSGVALLLAGITFVHFAHASWLVIVGIVCAPLGLLTAAIGVFRYRRMNRSICVLRQSTKKKEAK